MLLAPKCRTQSPSTGFGMQSCRNLLQVLLCVGISSSCRFWAESQAWQKTSESMALTMPMLADSWHPDRCAKHSDTLWASRLWNASERSCGRSHKVGSPVSPIELCSCTVLLAFCLSCSKLYISHWESDFILEHKPIGANKGKDASLKAKPVWP